MATQQPWDQDNPAGTLYCPPGDGCPSWPPLPEAFPAPCKVSWKLFLLHRRQTLSPQPWSSLPAAPGDGMKVLKEPFSILLLEWNSSAVALGCAGSSRALLSAALWGGICLEAAAPCWHPFFSHTSRRGMGWSAKNLACVPSQGLSKVLITSVPPLSTSVAPGPSLGRRLSCVLISTRLSCSWVQGAAWLPSMGFVGIPHPFPLPWEHQPGLSSPPVAIMACPPCLW